jgi:penicillin-insensitive murein endopeptidase
VSRRGTEPKSTLGPRSLALATVAFGCVFYCGGSPAHGGGPAGAPQRERTESHSIGSPQTGRVLRAVRLRASATVRHVPQYMASGNFYGTAELVGLLERTARAVATRWPDSPLWVGELSAAGGGHIEGHNSHRSGRDADLAFYIRSHRGVAESFWRFVTFDGQGLARRAPRPMHFDDARNWALVASMLRDPIVRVQYLFVAKPIRTRLLMEGRRRGESDAFLRAAAAVLVEPQSGHKHANHFHLRIFCPPDDRPECLDSAPYWPWYDGAAPAGGYAELPSIRWHVPAAAASSSAAQPRAASKRHHVTEIVSSASHVTREPR